MIDDESLKSIENLHRLKNEGIITEEEFNQSKQRLLFGAKPAAPPTSLAALNSYTGTLPAQDDHIGWITLPLRRYADFTGRSTRKEFWMFQLLPLGLFLLTILIVGFGDDETHALGSFMTVIIVLGLIGLFIPQLAVQARRFHDQDRSGWLVLINLIPYVGAVAVLIVMLLEGTKGENRFGPDPYTP